MFSHLTFKFYKKLLRRYFEKASSIPEQKKQEQALLELFRNTARSVPAYKKLLAEKGISPESVKTIDDFRSTVPLIDKHNTFIQYEDKLEELCVDGCLGDVVSVLTSSGHSGRFSYGVISKNEDKSVRTFVDLFIDLYFDIENQKTFLINCLPMGVKVPSNLMVVADVSVRPDMALALIKSFGRKFDQIIVVGENTFIKFMLDLGIERRFDWPSYNIKLILGEETFPEGLRTYLGTVLGKNIDTAGKVIIGSSMGISEIGLSVFQESLTAIRIRRLLDKDHTLRKKYFGDITFTPMLFHYLPFRLYIETVSSDTGGRFPELVITPLSRDRRLPLIRYNTHDSGMIFTPDMDILNVIEKPKLPMVAVFGRGKGIQVSGRMILIEEIKELLYSDMDIASRLTGNFLMNTLSQGPRPAYLKIQLRKGIQAFLVKDRIYGLFSEYYSDIFEIELAAFENMPIDFERKLPYIV
jgi:phenylacetate-CoA ligase